LPACTSNNISVKLGLLSGLGVATTVQQFTWFGLIASQTQAYEVSTNAKKQAQNFAYWNQSFMKFVVESCFDFMAN
jgi:hypothetical protein